MPWIQARFKTCKADQSSLEDALLAAGAQSITYQDAADQPILEPGLHETPLWDDLLLTALFTADTDMTGTMAEAALYLNGELPDHTIEILEDKDWSREWMQHYQPMCFGQRLWICPSWIDPPQPEATNLLLDPGLAFGTGTHPTTAMCMQVLDTLDVTGLDILDYGCGSGILAIAALLLGARHATGIDIDPQAIHASHENSQRNNISDNQMSLYLVGKAPRLDADIVLANILAGPLVDLAPTLQDAVRPGGQLVLSGIIESQKADIVQAYGDIEWLAFHQQDEWLCCHGRRRH